MDFQQIQNITDEMDKHGVLTEDDAKKIWNANWEDGFEVGINIALKSIDEINSLSTEQLSEILNCACEKANEYLDKRREENKDRII